MISAKMAVKSRYIPILKAKLAEFEALRELPAQIRQQVTPVIELRAEAGAETWGKRFATHWGEGAPIYVDVVAGRRGRGLASASDVLARVLEYCRLKGVLAIPVTGLIRPDAYQEVVASATRKDMRGVLIRLSPADAERNADLKALVREHGNNRSSLAALLDFGPIEPNATTQTALAALSLLAPLRGTAKWSLVGLASTSFPQRLGELPKEEVGDGVTRALVKRADWDAWTRVRRSSTDSSAVPTYSDYTVQHPKETEIDRKNIPRVPNIRYTLDDTWVIYQGKNLNKVASPTFRDLCGVLTGNGKEFTGASHCAGDQFLLRCARGEVTPIPANYAAWRRPCFTHHIASVLQRLPT